MKISYNEATAKNNSSLIQDLILCEQAGFDFIEIRLDMLAAYLKTHSVGELAEFFKSHAIKPHAFNALYLYDEMYSDKDFPEQRARVEDQLLSACLVGQAIGGPLSDRGAPAGRDRV